MPRTKISLWVAVALIPVVGAALRGFCGGPQAPSWMMVALAIAILVLTGILVLEFRRPDQR